jgi:LPXTG-motif cell wall-anchored protein
MQYKYAPFLVIGIVFVVLGASGQRTLLWVGIVFLMLAVAMFRRKRL